MTTNENYSGTDVTKTEVCNKIRASESLCHKSNTVLVQSRGVPQDYGTASGLVRPWAVYIYIYTAFKESK